MQEQRLQNFRILAKIGEGGMGEVFKGFDVLLERDVAIKCLRPELAFRSDLVERFRTEAIALAKLNHPSIATLYSFFRFENQFFMVLEFVHGETLDGLIARLGALPWPKATRLLCQTLDGLEHAHGMGIIHRDIKPANLMLTSDGTPKLMDFGIARIMEKARLTQTGHLIGTLKYMSPEQIQGEEVDGRSDLYALGAIFYEMLTGHVPFEKASDYDLIKAQVEEPPPPPRVLMPAIPAKLENAVLRALAKDPADRFPDASAFRSELEHILNTLTQEESRPLVTHQQTFASPPFQEKSLDSANFAGPASSSSADFSGQRSKRKAFRIGRSHFQRHRKRYSGVAILLLVVGMAIIAIQAGPFSAASLASKGPKEQAAKLFLDPQQAMAQKHSPEAVDTPSKDNSVLWLQGPFAPPSFSPSGQKDSPLPKTAPPSKSAQHSKALTPLREMPQKKLTEPSQEDWSIRK